MMSVLAQLEHEAALLDAGLQRPDFRLREPARAVDEFQQDRLELPSRSASAGDEASCSDWRYWRLASSSWRPRRRWCARVPPARVPRAPRSKYGAQHSQDFACAGAPRST